jgi:uncharacterized membrane protein
LKLETFFWRFSAPFCRFSLRALPLKSFLTTLPLATRHSQIAACKIPPHAQIAGQSAERLVALSDGIFAVAMTLLVLDLKVPASEAILSEHDLSRTLIALASRLLMFAMSILTLGIFWVGQPTQLNHLERSDRSLSWIHIAFLGFVSLVPFSTALLAEFTAYRTALLAYWLNILLLGLTLYLSWTRAVGQQLLKPEISCDIHSAIQRRILIAQALYLFCALLCVFSTYWSIVFIVAVQLNYAIVPRLPRRRQ